MQGKNLSLQHQSVWNMLRSMKDGERIIGADLRELANVPEERTFYKIIEDLRDAGIFIGASRNEPRGYYEIRSDHDARRFFNLKQAELVGELAALQELERKWENRNNPQEDDENDGDDQVD